jgi:regulator of replication initiation timing
MTKRGPNDLEQQIEDLNAVKVALYAEVKKYREENDALQKQKIYLQKQCRRAGAAILAQETLNSGLKKDIDRLAEENENLLTMYNGKR